ncbi:MAG: uracil-DNA glycosylase [bacterium]|nr:uracil-DNA glycosylase [bacterium]
MNQNTSNDFLQVLGLFKEHIEDILSQEGNILVEENVSIPIEETLDKVKKEINNCQKCKLSHNRTNIVFGVGNEKAKLLIIGEAPGYDEDIKGEPFVGKAGQLLTRMLIAINMKRSDVYITNVVKCRPPNNRNPLNEEISTCEPYLLKQLNIIKPKIILTLGNFAAQTLLHTSTGITKLRGKFYFYHDIKLLPIFHPAAVLRNSNLRKPVWEDLQLLRDEYQKL